MRNLKAVLTLLVAVVMVAGLSACAEGEGEGPGADTTMASDTMGMQDDDMQGGMQDGMMSDSVTVQGTISMLQQGVMSIPVSAAVQNISGWEAKLDNMADNMDAAGTNDTFDDLSDKLDDLKDELQSDNLDGEDIGEALQELGRLTNQAAQSASGQTMTQLQSLGQALTQGGTQLTSGQDTM